tara:strand:+ start:429 stop:812 length:384 start_codon:yes stop_codon:yes gene_type:complete
MTTQTTPPASKKERTVDVLCGAFDLNERRKFEIKDPNGDLLLELYFKPVTRSDRLRVQATANSDDALKQSTVMLCQLAEHEDGTKAFALADVAKLQRELPESVLNEIELFLFNVNEKGESLDDLKND